MNRKLVFLWGAVFAMIAGALVALWLLRDTPEEPVDGVETEDVEIVFLDVGQGDAVLIQASSGQSVLYDGGPRESNMLDQLQVLGVEELTLVIASHPHADHIGGLIAVVEHYQPTYFIDNGEVHTTQTYEDLLDALESAETQVLEPTRRTITLGEQTELEILPPPGYESWGLNDNSVVALVRHGAFRLSLAGDAEERQWEYLLEEWEQELQDVQVHKSSHHGSRNGDTERGMQLLNPEVVVISAGADNRYGHPHDEALALYAGAGATVYRTDRDGAVRIVASVDGSYDAATTQGAAPMAAATPGSSPVSDTQASEACVDLNSATLAELQRIVHVGPSRAEDIVRLRPYHTIAELARIGGVGEAMISDIEAQGVTCIQ